MKKFLFYTLAALSYLVLFTLLIVSIVFALLQTPFFQKKLTSFIEKKTQEMGVTTHIEGLRGSPPFSWKIDRLDIAEKDLGSAHLENISLHIALFPLFHGKFVVKNLDVESAAIHINSRKPSSSSSPLASDEILFFIKSFRQICFHKVVLEDEKSQKGTFYLLAQTTEKKKQESLKIKVLNQESSSSCELFAKYLPLQCLFHANLNLDLRQDLPFFPFPLELQANLNVDGPLSLSPFNFLLDASLDMSLHPYGVKEMPCFERPWEAKSHFFLSNDKIVVENVQLTSTLAKLEAEGSYLLKQNELSYALLFNFFDLKSLLAPLGIEGNAKLNIKGSSHAATLTLESESISISDQELSPLEIETKLSKTEEGAWCATLEGKGYHSAFPLTLFSQLSLSSDHTLCIDSFVINTDFAQFSTQAKIALFPLAINGCSTLNIYKLSAFGDLLQGASVEGKLGMTACFVNEDASFKLHAEGLRYNDTYVSMLDVESKLSHYLTNPTGMLSCALSNLSSSSYYIDTLKIDSATSIANEWPYQVVLQGNWKTPCSVAAEGKLRFDPTNTLFSLESLKGELLGQQFLLKEPAYFSNSVEKQSLSPCVVTTSEGKLAVDFSHDKERFLLNIDIEHLPLELLAISNADFSLSGRTSLSVHAQAIEEDLFGHVRMTIEEVGITQNASQETKQAKGIIEAHLGKNHIQAFAELYGVENHRLSFQGTIPFQFHNTPLQFKIEPDSKLYAKLDLQGKVEELFDFIDLGASRITGELKTDLLISNTLNHPHLKGTVELQEGSYQSYLLGSQLEKIHLKLIADNDKARLIEFTASDLKGGSVSGNGVLELSQQREFPFQFDLNLDHLEYLNLDTMKASFSGPVTLTGNAKSLNVKCSLEIPEASCLLAETASPPLPNLEVEFINQPKKVMRATQKVSTLPFQVNLDAEVDAHSKVFVSGKGLSSEWGGHLLIKTDEGNNVELQGKLNLLKGEYLFSGKRFNLQEGELTFSKDTPYILLIGTTEIAGYTISVQVRGSLTEPSISFTSLPSLPTSSILSYILFNKDISEITPFQAIQLAQTLVSLSSSSGSDILDKIRTSLGVDRFGIVSDSRGGDQVSLQIGKYLTQGVLVTLSQSTTSSDVIVEIDLKHGFIFQAETQDQQEGKFSLKWHHNY